jgi:hypothetical protein
VLRQKLVKLQRRKPIIASFRRYLIEMNLIHICESLWIHVIVRIALKSVVKPDKSELKLTCLRDIAALQSLVRDLSAFRDGVTAQEISPSYTTTDEYRQICGIGGNPITVPLVQVELHFDLVSGTFEFVMCNSLPKGIDILAGNDLFFNNDVDSCVVTRFQSATAERLAAKRQVSVNNDNNNTDFGEDSLRVCSETTVGSIRSVRPQQNPFGKWSERTWAGFGLIAPIAFGNALLRLVILIGLRTLTVLFLSRLT